MLVPALIVLALVALNGLFVAAEFAAIGAPRAAVERRAAEGGAAARLAWRIMSDPVRQDRFIATAQLGITFASLGLGMYGEHALAEWLAERLGGAGLEGLGLSVSSHALASVLAIAALTYLHVVLGEMVPKSLALSRAEATVYRVARPMLVVQTALYPLVVGLNAVGNALLRAVGVRRERAAGHYHTPEELADVVRESEAGGLMRSEAGRVVRELFAFGGRTAGDVMVPRVRVVGLPLGTPHEALRERLLDEAHTRYPVYEGDLDHVVGVVHVKDVLRLVRAARALEAADVRPAVFVPEGAGLDRVLAAMGEARTQLAVVMDEHGGTAGIVTIEDLGIEAVGEVEEGAGEGPPDVEPAGPGAFSVDGAVRLEDLEEWLGRPVVHAEVETVSGLVLVLLGRPPAAGDAVEHDGVRFEVEVVEGLGVGRCRVGVPGGGGPSVPSDA
ncbi:hemolysin family protein [Rubrivirga marina]|uniref:Hemolysin n=1 Tax=Rubrivirga marina TaxID=1196024 RepID=A0A271J229_9BACT|nr:hemolysin family protein [Rubrivirga marina]PAP77104.1 hypothetical protein BSZ37_12040 [Rubrivirga marina]